MDNDRYSLNITTLLHNLGTNEETGLTDEEATNRLEKFGYNELVKAKKKHPIFLFLEQFSDPLVIILLFALLISVIIGFLSPNEEDKIEYYIDALAITTIVLFNAIFGFIQEYKAEKSIEALKSLAPQYTTVLRDGVKKRIEAKQLVPGDIVFLEEGDKIAADGRLLQAHALRIDESALTGESFPVAKEVKAIISNNVAIADRLNSVFSGTNVTRGRGQALIFNTGMKTEFGKIATGLMEEGPSETPLQKRLAILGKWIGIGSLTICGIIFSIGILLKQDIIEMFVVAVGLAVAAVPEGLPAVVTLALAIGVQRMSRKNAIIRRLPSVETLGSITVICSDKTGTLTMNKMMVRRILSTDKIYEVSESMEINDTIRQILTVGKVCNNAQLARGELNDTKGVEKEEFESDIGDPTELALLKVADLVNIKTDYQRLYEIPFDSNSKRMSVIVKNPNEEYFVFTKGAPDVLINLCESFYSEGNLKPLNNEFRQELEDSVQEVAKGGYRMLGMAYKSISKEKAELKILSEDTEEIEARLIYIGAVAIMDPPREGTKNSIEVCKNAGIRPIMITGDHLKTAVAIAKEIGLIESEEKGGYIEGNQISNMSDADLQSVVNSTSIFARVSPHHKLKLISALKRNNHIVAMTGDGVNDAPALKRADIGVAMGISGTDVSKEASDMVLADDDFSTIVGAILEGRTIYDNMRKFILYLLSCNSGEIAVMFLGIVITTLLFSKPILPLIAIQILWVNLITDGLPALAMGIDPPDSDIMNRKPRDPKESILTRKSVYFIVYSGFLIGIGTLALFLFYLMPEWIEGLTFTEDTLAHAGTVAFTMLIIFQMIMALNIRKEEHSLLGKEFFRNPYLLMAIASSIILHLMIVYVPAFQVIFHTKSLNLLDWIIILAVGSILVIVDELRNYLAHKSPNFRSIAGYW